VGGAPAVGNGQDTYAKDPIGSLLITAQQSVELVDMIITDA
jgi:hypothetical protein